MDTLRVEAIARGDDVEGATEELTETSGSPDGVVDAFLDGSARRIPLYRREVLAAGFEADGPLLAVDPVSTIVVEPGWRLRVDERGNLVLSRSAPRAVSVADASVPDPVRLENMSALFMAIAENMGRLVR